MLQKKSFSTREIIGQTDKQLSILQRFDGIEMEGFLEIKTRVKYSGDGFVEIHDAWSKEPKGNVLNF